ncbi:MAG: hypothetical protein JRH20_23930 [Deltaproteobacteria bacterium]|nr:hypothetical protein [Deltaproteobacteria bacterium]
MSRAYRIALTERVRRHVTLDDGVQTELELLPILCPERMAELLAAELVGLGFTREGGKAQRADEDGVELVVDLLEGTLAAKISGEAELEEEGRVVGVAQSEAGAREKAETRRAGMRRQLEARMEGERRVLQQELSGRLEQRLRDLRHELDGACTRTVAAALKEKAATLGEIEEISEDAETGSLLIRVRV